MDAKLTLKQLFVLLRALDNSALSSDAKDLLIHFMVNQGEDWIHHEGFIVDKKGWYHRRYMTAKKELSEAGLIESSFVYENRKRNGCKIIVNYEWQGDENGSDFSKVSICNVTNSNVTDSDFTGSTKVTICNVTPSNVTPSNVTSSDVLISKKSKIKEENSKTSKKSEIKQEKPKRKLKEKNPRSQTEIAPFLASDYTEEDEDIPSDILQETAPKTENTPATFEDVFGPDNQPQKKAKEKKAKKPALKFQPPTQEEIRDHIAESVRNNNVEKYWTEQQISNLAGEIWNYYESVGWKVGNKVMEQWRKAVSGWCYRQNWMPRNTGNSAGRPKTFREIDQENRDRPFTHHEEHLIELAAKRILSTNSTEVLEGLPECLRDDALKLAEKMRKEQGDKPKVRLLL